MISKKEIERILKNGNKNKYSHLIINCDHWDYDYSTRYVKYDENIYEIIENIKKNGSVGMFTIEEIYNYKVDIEKQLKEHRAYHIEPIINKEELKQTSKVELAKSFATKKHNGQKRLDGKDYITHPIKVAETG